MVGSGAQCFCSPVPQAQGDKGAPDPAVPSKGLDTLEEAGRLGSPRPGPALQTPQKAEPLPSTGEGEQVKEG